MGHEGKGKEKGVWEWPGDKMNLYSVRMIETLCVLGAGRWGGGTGHGGQGGECSLAFGLEYAWGTCNVTKQLKYQKHLQI